MTPMDLKAYVRDIPGYPKPGIIFKDLTPMWQDPRAFHQMIEQLADRFRSAGVQVVAAIES